MNSDFLSQPQELLELQLRHLDIAQLLILRGTCRYLCELAGHIIREKLPRLPLQLLGTYAQGPSWLGPEAKAQLDLRLSQVKLLSVEERTAFPKLPGFKSLLPAAPEILSLEQALAPFYQRLSKDLALEGNHSRFYSWLQANDQDHTILIGLATVVSINDDIRAVSECYFLPGLDEDQRRYYWQRLDFKVPFNSQFISYITTNSYLLSEGLIEVKPYRYSYYGRDNEPGSCGEGSFSDGEEDNNTISSP